MQHKRLRQVAIAFLALVFVLAAGRSAWSAQRAARAQAELGRAARWLRGAVVVLDPGHGGSDPGAVVGQTREKHLVLEISLAVKEILEQHGATVFLTRESDVDLGGPIREELGKRVAIVEKHRPAAFVSIHANKDRCNCWGAQTFYQRNGMPAGKALALALQHQLRELTPTTRVALPADYFVLRTTSVPAAVVEVGFLTNAKEHQRLLDPAYQRRLATAIVLGVGDFIRGQVPPAEAGGTIGQ